MEISGWSPAEMVSRTEPAALSGDIFPFGKYRGQSISAIARRDPGYLRWVLDNVRDLRPPLRQALRKYVKDDQ